MAAVARASACARVKSILNDAVGGVRSRSSITRCSGQGRTGASGIRCRKGRGFRHFGTKTLSLGCALGSVPHHRVNALAVHFLERCTVMHLRPCSVRRFRRGAGKAQRVSHFNQEVGITDFPKLWLKVKQPDYFAGRCWRAPCPDRAENLLPITCLVGSSSPGAATYATPAWESHEGTMSAAGGGRTTERR